MASRSSSGATSRSSRRSDPGCVSITRASLARHGKLRRSFLPDVDPGIWRMIMNRTSKSWALALVLGSVLFPAGGGTARGGEPHPPAIRKLGTLDLDMVEATPVVFRDRLYRFEYVRKDYKPNTTGESYFRFIDAETGKATPAFARGYDLGCAYAEGGTMWAFGVDQWDGTKVVAFRSDDLEHWEKFPALELPGWGLFNTSVCKAGDRYVMAIEVGKPPEVVGVPFTARFAESKDLKTWTLLHLPGDAPRPPVRDIHRAVQRPDPVGGQPAEPAAGRLGGGQDVCQPEADRRAAEEGRRGGGPEQLGRGLLRVPGQNSHHVQLGQPAGHG